MNDNKDNKTEYRQPNHISVPGATYFITSSTFAQFILPPRMRKIVLDEILKHDGTLYELFAAVVMPDHFHLLFRPLRDENGEYIPVWKIMNRVKGASSRKAKLDIAYKGALWLRGYFDILVGDGDDRANCWNYMLLNPVRKKIVENWKDYPFVWERGMDKVIEVTTPV